MIERVYIIYSADILGVPSDIEEMSPLKRLPEQADAWVQTEGDEQYDYGYLGDESDNVSYYPFGSMTDEPRLVLRTPLTSGGYMEQDGNNEPTFHHDDGSLMHDPEQDALDREREEDEAKRQRWVAERDAYNALIERVADSLGKPALAVLGRVRAVCEEAGMRVGEPSEMFDDEYRWSMCAWRPGSDADEDCIDITVEIAEQRQYEGGDADNPAYGVNFAIDIVEWGGRILGGLAPYNYTEQCWVPAYDDVAVSERWQIIADADVSEIPNLIMEGQA